MTCKNLSEKALVEVLVDTSVDFRNASDSLTRPPHTELKTTTHGNPAHLLRGLGTPASRGRGTFAESDPKSFGCYKGLSLPIVSTNC